jgi:hypothetical protein
MREVFLAVGVLVAFTRTADAQQTLQNDGFTSGMVAGFQGGFVAGEMGASRFVAPSGVQQLLRVQFLFGGAPGTRMVTLRVYDDPGGLAPGTELFSGDYDVTGNDMALSEIDLSTDNVQVPQQFRVALEFYASGYPCIARDDDGTITASLNYIYAGALGWRQSTFFGLAGDWVIRAVVSTAGGTPDAALPVIDANPNQPDADPNQPDADPLQPDGPPGGGDCQGNTDCPVGQYCNASMSCTFDCREDTDCPGSGTCNSLGQCLEGEGGGGCCRTDDGGNGAAGALFGFGVLVLMVRRRRR